MILLLPNFHQLNRSQKVYCATHTILEADDKKLKSIIDTLPPHIRSAISDQKILQKEFTVLTPSTKPVKKIVIKLITDRLLI